MKLKSLFLIQLFIVREKIFSVVMIHQHNSDTVVIIKKIINMYIVEKKEDQKWDLKKPTRDPSNNKNTLTKTNYREQNETITEE